ncbi:hypothetical protein K1719_022566 [Acacia pycnantha]|nr:hypothetical protein K1719_022566 [Acacia pycnantha]
MSSTDGDFIGTESCINDVSDNGFGDVNIDQPGPPVLKKQGSSRKKSEKREFPPPIPLLTRTHDLSFHMPWELKRYHTSDGRLILREEEAGYHHFFRAHRANGRLTLQLVVPVDHMFPTDHSPCLTAHYHDTPEQIQEFEEATPNQTGDDDETDDDRTGGVSAGGDRFGDESPNALLEVQEGLPRATNCNFNFHRVSSASSCLFETPGVSPIRTVLG